MIIPLICTEHVRLDTGMDEEILFNQEESVINSISTDDVIINSVADFITIGFQNAHLNGLKVSDECISIMRKVANGNDTQLSFNIAYYSGKDV